MNVIAEQDRKPIKAWTDGVELEQGALAQLRNTASLPFIYKHIAVMPDVHQGIGATVGSVIPTQGAIIPAAVGVDIGCGMIAARLPYTANDLPTSLAALRGNIEWSIPVGQNAHKNPVIAPADESAMIYAYNQIWAKHPKLPNPASSWYAKIVNQAGTLGGGNHFIEVCLDEEQRVWVMLHSGSRGIGNKIGQYFIELARQDMRTHFINLPDRDLAYLSEGTNHFDDYVKAVEWAQDYALKNRTLMLTRVLDQVARALPYTLRGAEVEIVANCHHNYVARENHFGQNILVTRKGAVRARLGDMGIIPGSMGARSFIVRGKGNAESFMSCSHGAGRRMSRTAAAKTFTLEEHAAATEGVECKKDWSVIDETPGAYKDIDAVMAAQTDLVEIVHTLKQVLCVKG
jgi:tRNA-splicing ligase RtcB